MGTTASGKRGWPVILLEDAMDRSVRTMSGTATILEALAPCGDLGRDKDNALLVVAGALDDARSDLANASSYTRQPESS